MEIPIRIKYVKKNNSTTKFDFWSGVKNFLLNIKIIFTSRILTGGQAFYITKEDVEILQDVSLVIENGEGKFIKTPKGEHSSMLELTKNVKS